MPGGFFLNRDGSPSEVGNLHVGIFDPANARPHPEPGGVPPRVASTEGRKPRIWILVGEGQSEADILDKAVRRGHICSNDVVFFACTITEEECNAAKETFLSIASSLRVVDFSLFA